MNRDDIIRMAREAGFVSHDAIINYPKELQRFAAIVAAAEREECAEVCDEIYVKSECEDRSGIEKCAEAIRARGQA